MSGGAELALKADCWDILTRFCGGYLDDYQSLTPDWLDELLDDPNFYLLFYQPNEQGKTKIVGLLWLSDIRLPISCQIHFLIRPGYIRSAIRQNLFPAIIDFVFAQYPVAKIKALFMKTQASAWRLLSRFGFCITGHYPADTMFRGEAVDRFSAELCRERFEFYKHKKKEFIMSFGKKEKDNDNNDKKAQQATQPVNFYSPFGNFVKGRFTPIESPDQIATRELANTSIRNLVSGIPTRFDINAYYSNPYYDTTLSLLNQPIQQQEVQDFRELNNQLSAQNQLGSSYDAYRRYLTEQRYDQSYRQAQNQARLASSDAYTASVNQSLSALQGLRNDQNAYMDTLYKPAQLALGYQQAVSPLQQTLSNYYSNQSQQQMRLQQEQLSAQQQSARLAAQLAMQSTYGDF